MSDSSASFWKSIAIFLLLLLFGVYVLYEWYDEQLYARIAEKEAAIEQMKDEVKEADARRLASEQAEQGLRAELSAQKERNVAITQAEGEVERAMAALRETHAAELAAEQQRTGDLATERDQLAARLSDAESRYGASQDQVKALQADLGKVQQAIKDTAAEHQAKIAALEKNLNERVQLARTTPMDESLLRTAQEVGVLPVVQAFQQECKSADEAIAGAKSELEALKTQHADSERALAETRETLARVEAELVQAKGERRDPAAAEEVARLTQRLAAESDVREGLQRQHEAALAALESALTDTKQALKSAQDALAQASAQPAVAEPDAAAQDTLKRATALESELRSAQTEAARVQSALRDEITGLKAQLTKLQNDVQQAQTASSTTHASTSDALAAAEARVQALSAELEQARQGSAEAKGAEAELARLRRLRDGFAKLNGTYTERGLLLRLAETELRFPAGQATLPASDLPSLDSVAALVKDQPELSVRVEGHTDSSGGDALNLELSRQRAEAVAKALEGRGVDASRIQAEGLGSARPIGSNATAQGRGLNRRVEIYLND